MKRIFIVDDSQLYIDIMQSFLTHDGYEVGSTTDPVNALEQIAAFDPDVIIIDLIMPEKNGCELILEIREHDLLKKIPVILISAEEVAEIVRKKKDFNFNDYISKTERAEDILSRIETYSSIGEIQRIIRGMNDKC